MRAQKTSRQFAQCFAQLPNPPPYLTYPPLALSSATFHSRLKTEILKLSHPDSTNAPRHVRRHHRLQPYYSSTLSPRLDLSGF